MGALYEDVENFFGDIFAWYGRIVARHPFVFVLIPLLSCCLLGLGLLNLEYETNLENLYTPVSSQALHDRDALTRIFPADTSSEHFYARQQIVRSVFGEVLVRPKSAETSDDDDDDDDHVTDDVVFENRSVLVRDERTTAAAAAAAAGNLSAHEAAASSPSRRSGGGGGDVLSPAVIAEVRRVYRLLRDNMTIVRNGRRLTYVDVCAKRDGRCVVDGLDLLRLDAEATAAGAENAMENATDGAGCISTQDAAIYHGILSGMASVFAPATADGGGGSGRKSCLSAKALKLRFYLNRSVIYNKSNYTEMSVIYNKSNSTRSPVSVIYNKSNSTGLPCQ